MILKLLQALLLSGVYLTVSIRGHGMLMDPPARNAIWRLGYPNPVNYDDNQLYCGGFIVQYGKNGGKCGVCGDDYREKVPRSHEAGGLYGKGIVGRRYAAGQVIEIEADLTTIHRGHMEVKFCPNNNPNKDVTQQCLDENTLPIVDNKGNLVDGGETKYIVVYEEGKKKGIFRWRVKLPDGITCTNCIIQWKYFAGNTWGQCTNGTGGLGCGNQETFINCADVSVTTGAVTGSGAGSNIWGLLYRNQYPGVFRDDNLSEFTQLVVRSRLCLPVGEFAKVEGMDSWCRQNCLKFPPNCHPEACQCVNECDAIGDFALLEGSDMYCQQHCLKYPSECPPEKCKCY